MKKTYALALVIALAAAPAAAQPEPKPAPRPMAPGPAGPGPFGPGPIGPVFKDFGPIGPLPPIDLDMPARPFPMIDLDMPALMELKSHAVLFEDAGKLMKLASPGLMDVAAEAKILAAEAKLLDLESKFMLDRPGFPFAQDRATEQRDREAELKERERERAEREREREAELYSQGQSAADEYRWDRALTYFTRVIEMRGSRVDAALYWKAFSQNRLGQRSEALATIAELSKGHPNSPYRKQANVLEAEVRRDAGQPVRPQDSADDDVKLMALQALQNTAPEEAVPIIEKLLEGTAARKVKQRALYVLAQSKSPRAREVLRNYAKGSSTPELQSQAIQYLGVHGGAEARAVLAEVYGSTSDLDVKRRILRAFMVAGEKDRLFKAAQGEQNAELRAEAVTQLGNMHAHEELWQLYQRESSVDVKRRIVRAMQAGGSVDRLIELAKAEQNPEIRRDVVRALGVTRATRTGDVLVQIYGTESNPDVKKSVISALFVQENATALVGLARKEQDSTMKKEIVGRLSQMRSKVATDYMIELLGK